MLKWIIAYIAAAVAFGALDSVWLRWASDNLYRPVIGEIMAESFRMGPAIAFYLIYIGGMTWFAIRPGLETGNVFTAALNGAILGFVCYATFDFTSQAVMKVWAWHISIADIAWGTFATSIASTIACGAALRLA
ncbi:DUF2177 family protein [Aurantiacibacter aquimixticola]|uniref:DUF2177 family protein n=1 Tax=Aurantiacibacter aquimixticola TaxID=1958945 RepID=A0A419RWI2_9SPHN|nr:DUF2177 family protein [Aurantiacibacter aquimixticola]RJY10141.1 DUF2177 family protein [Aurantiacibacter aquimixticola]